MSIFFDKALHFLGKQNKEVVALNIGAMDGVMFDEMYGYSAMYDFKVLYVEPIPYLFNRLKTNVTNPKSLFENSAISDYDGSIDMITINREVIDSGLVHNCFYGMSAVYPPKNGLGSEFDRKTVESYGEIVKVNCITFNTLIDKHRLESFDIVKIDAEGHDFHIFKQIDLEKYNPKVIRLEWVNLDEDSQNQIIETLNKFKYHYEIDGQDISAISESMYDEIYPNGFIDNTDNMINEIYSNNVIDNKITLVTGLWDIGRGDLSEGWSRSFDHYLNKFSQLLEVNCNMIIFGDRELESFIKERRNDHNTQFILRDLEWFKSNEFYGQIQQIRNNPKWFNLAGWLKDSTQARLEMYNPLVMSKMYLLHDALLMDKFESEKLYWIDAGLSNTVNMGYFTHDNVLDKMDKLFDNFTFVCFPYQADREIHGFDIDKMTQITNVRVDKVARGGFFGGTKESIKKINTLYYDLMKTTLSKGLMGTEESLFSILLYNNPTLTEYVEINQDGLMYKFFEDVKNDSVQVKTMSNGKKVEVKTNGEIGLYVITYNSPKQFEVLINSMLEYDPNFINKTKKFLLDNSTDLTTTPRYLELCEKYNFEHIKKDNIGITGGRVFIAEHFDKTEMDYYIFVEDDMTFYNGSDQTCKNGFIRKSNNLYKKILQITRKEQFDFLKLNFTEFYGSHEKQWSWFNVDQEFRKNHWPFNQNLAHHGESPNAPNLEFKHIKSHEGLPYATGEVYLSNWPIILSREGNYKCYIETKFDYPYEQTLMSHCYKQMVNGRINAGVLLMTPTEHNRFDFYEGHLRKEF